MKYLLHQMKFLIPSFKVDAVFLIKAFAFEVSVIIIAILLAFEFNLYRQDYKLDQTRKNSYQILLAGLDIKTQRVQNAIENINAYEKTYEKINNDFKTNKKILFNDFFSYYGTILFIPQNEYYWGLKKEGIFNELKDINITQKYEQLRNLSSLIKNTNNTLNEEFFLMLKMFAYQNIDIANNTFKNNADFNFLHNIISIHFVSLKYLRQHLNKYSKILKDIKLLVKKKL